MCYEPTGIVRPWPSARLAVAFAVGTVLSIGVVNWVVARPVSGAIAVDQLTTGEARRNACPTWLSVTVWSATRLDVMLVDWQDPGGAEAGPAIRRVDGWLLGEIRNVAGVARLREVVRSGANSEAPSKCAVVAVDDEVAHGEVVTILDELRGLGVERLSVEGTVAK